MNLANRSVKSLTKRSARTAAFNQAVDMALESLEGRRMFAVSAVSVGGLLTVFGDNNANNIVVSRDVAGRLLVNGGSVSIIGTPATVANTSLIQVFGLNGDDTITLDEANGALPKANLFGGAGNDILTGGSGSDQIFGEAGNDTLLGKGGVDFLFGGAGNDTLTGGTDNDQVFGQAGNDLMIWNPGEGSDLNEGGDGIDTVQVNGGNGAESFTATPNGTRVRFDRVSPAPFFLDIGTSENLVLNANGGDDTFTGANGLAPLISLTVDGGTGNDTITGGDGNDTLIGGDGNDLITGGRGADTALLGAGDDTFVWNPGDGSDVVEGQDGNDTMLFNGANVNENITLSANGNRLKLFRDVGNVTMDTNGVENVNLNTLGGADAITFNDLSATSVTHVNLDLGAVPGTVGGDAAADTVTINGTNNADSVQVNGAGMNYTVTGLSTVFAVNNSEGALDNLAVNLLGGKDTFDASGLPSGITALTVDGGKDDDVLTGSQGNDTLIGGDGSDLITGGRGADTALMGNGNDTFVWNPGDGSDIVEGQGDSDTMVFNGANVNENMTLSANGSRLKLFRDVGNITMDTSGVEQVNITTLGGADTVTVNDLTGTGVTTVNVDLAGSAGGGDNQADTVIVNGTANADQINVAGKDGNVRVGGLAARVNIFNSEPANDQLIVNALGGADTIDAGALEATSIQLVLNGGTGNDVLLGSQGDDTFIWNPGDASDTIEGRDGNDTLVFNGSNANENMVLSANGNRLRLTRDVGNVVMDVHGTENVNVNALGGTDTVTVNDLSATDVVRVSVDLGVSAAPDAAADTVIVKGTDDSDVILLSGDASAVEVTGLAAQVEIKNLDTFDNVTVDGLGGDDAIVASGLPIGVNIDGGEGDDVLIGGDGIDTLSGGNGDDVLIGNAGQDLLDGGAGDNVLIQ